MDYRVVAPGLFPQAALLFWIVVSAAFFLTLRPARAVMLTLLGGMLFLPERVEFDLPLVPPIGKQEMASLCAIFGASIRCRGLLWKARPGRGLDRLILTLMLGAIPTVMANEETLFNGVVVRPGLTGYDALSMGVRDLLGVGIPFFLGRALFRTPEDLLRLLKYVVGFGLAYSALILIEVRMSPQMHFWIYGYHAHDFSQTMRWGGYRPTALMIHGLAVSIFALVVTLASVVLAKAKKGILGIPSWPLSLYLFAVLVLCKSTGAIIFAVVLVPIAALVRPVAQLRFAMLLSLVIALYPASKILGFFPDVALVSAAEMISAERADSLDDRFVNDEMLVDRAKEKIAFGWGSYGRPRVFNEKGEDLSVTDGYWIIQLGARGVLGLFSIFGLLLTPVFLARKALRGMPDPRDRAMLSGLALIVMIYASDLLPNGLYTNIPFFFAGALAGLAQGLSASRARSTRSARSPIHGLSFVSESHSRSG